MKNNIPVKTHLTLLATGLVLALNQPGFTQTTKVDPTRPHTPPVVDPVDPTDIRPSPPVLDSHTIPPELGPEHDIMDEDLSTTEELVVPEHPAASPLDPEQENPTPPVLEQDAVPTLPEPTELDPEIPPLE